MLPTNNFSLGIISYYMQRHLIIKIHDVSDDTCITRRILRLGILFYNESSEIFARRNMEKHCCSRYQWYVDVAGRTRPVAASSPATTWRTSYNSAGGWASTRIFSSKATISVKLGAINFNTCELNRGGPRVAAVRSIGRLSTRWDLSAHPIKLTSGD